jgi:hypothetical protein
MKCTIYTLLDSESKPFYVGSTSTTLNARLYQHKHGKKGYSGRIMIAPKPYSRAVVLELCPPEDRERLETEWLAVLRSVWGERIVNTKRVKIPIRHVSPIEDNCPL